MKRRSRLVLLLCILIAFILWVVYTLSNEYTSYFRFPLEVETNLDGRTNTSQADNTLFLRGTARGSYIIRHTWRKKTPQIRIFADKNLLRMYPEKDGEFYLLADNVHNLVNDALGTDLQLEVILTDTIRLEYKATHHKKVPITLVADLSYKAQHMSFEPIRIQPDSVLVYAEESTLALIDEIRTRRISLTHLDKTVEGIARLEVPANTRLSYTDVNYEVMVKRYIELSFQVPVMTANVPPRVDLLLLPDKITVQFRCPFEDAVGIKEDDFVLVVDYNRFVTKDSGKTIPELQQAPAVVSHIQFIPQFVDGIIQNRY
ncbi:MAG: hypothetical protein GX877_01620 [Bacteroidales bacterium]|nr:hypothetical protein [Bacteroidales bacterium]